MIRISHKILIQHYNMYLVYCEIFLKFLKFPERCCGRTNFWYPGPWLLWKWLCNMWLKWCTLWWLFTVLSIVSSKLCTTNLIIPWHYIYAANCINKKLILDLSSSFFWYSWSFHLLENIKIVIQVLYKFLTSKLITGSTINSEISL